MRYNPYKSLTSIGFTKQTPKRRYFKTQFLKKTPNKTRTPSYKRLPKITNKEFLYGDFDGDKVINKYDCKPFDKKKQGTLEEDFMRLQELDLEVTKNQNTISTLWDKFNKLPNNSNEDKFKIRAEINELYGRNIALQTSKEALSLSIKNHVSKRTGNQMTENQTKSEALEGKRHAHKLLEYQTLKGEKTPKINSLIASGNIDNPYVQKVMAETLRLENIGYDTKYAENSAKLIVEKEINENIKPLVKTKNWSGRTLQGLKLKPLG